jgi:AcrR family transcriptional regulator
MFTDMMRRTERRTYVQRKRAADREQTRRRIVQATMELHEDLGAARTSISAIAERAGVQRLTVYRHFPDDAALLHACTSRWLELNPPPADSTWDGDADPEARVRAALAAYYAYYRRTRRMWQSSYRDIDLVPALAERMAQVEAHLDLVAGRLVAPFRRRGKAGKHSRIVARHGLQFSTWQSLAGAGLADAAAATLVARWVVVAGQAAGPSPRARA